jgi:catechol 2,3-dioxygenase-like lactoylglutathione lyase family enzyme
MEMARVILFTGQMDEMSKFYGEVLGLKQVSSENGWREFAAGGARIALHSGPSSPGRKGPKIVFHAKDVAAVRETLVARGARFGKVRRGEMFCLCDGKDPGRKSDSVVGPVRVHLPSRLLYKRNRQGNSK